MTSIATHLKKNLHCHSYLSCSFLGAANPKDTQNVESLLLYVVEASFDDLRYLGFLGE